VNRPRLKLQEDSMDPSHPLAWAEVLEEAEARFQDSRPCRAEEESETND